MRGKSISKSQRRKPLDAGKSKDRVGIVASGLGCDSFALCSAVRGLGVVNVHCLAPRLVIAKFEIRPDVHKRDQLLTLGHDRLRRKARLAVDRLIVPEAACAFVRTEPVVPVRRRLVVAVVRGTFVFRVEWSAGQFSFAFHQCQFTLVLCLELFWGERKSDERSAHFAANAVCSPAFNRTRL
eukprot:6183820-Pleurochrysis_carterae.AAC.1